MHNGNSITGCLSTIEFEERGENMSSGLLEVLVSETVLMGEPILFSPLSLISA